MKKYILFILISVLFCSCNDDFLNKAPGVNLDETKVFGSFESAEKYHADIYTSLRKGFNVLGDNDSRAPLACATDEAESRYGWHSSNSFNVGHYDGVDNQIWRNYEGIRKANVFLSKKEVIPFPNEDTKKRMLGEAYFLRAFYYHEVVKRYGGMPDLTDKILQPNDDLNISRSSYMESVGVILADLERAISNLPVRMSDNEQGRATRGAALSLKSRVLLYAASPLWNAQNTNPLKWELAYKAAKDVLDLKDEDGNVAYKLYSMGGKENDYEKTFLLRQDEGNTEVIFWYNSTSVGFVSHEIKEWAPAGTGFGGSGAVAPTQNFVDLYEMANGMNINESGSGYDDQDPYTGRDPRFYKTIIYNGSSWQGITAELYMGGAHRINKNNSVTGYYVRKYLPESVRDRSSNQAYHNWIYFRLAEIYLNYAEALNETLPAPDTDVYNAVNEVRQRSGMPKLPNGLTRDQMRERIKNERAIELSFEEHRWWDVRRWMEGEKYFNGSMYEMEIIKEGDGTLVYNVIPFETRIFTPKMNLYPIPTTEINKNPLYRQNPGWN